MQTLGEVHESGVALAASRTGGVGVERGPHACHIGKQIERGAIVKKAAPLRVERHEIEMLFQIAASLGIDSLEHSRDRQDGRAHVEPEALLGKHGRLAANPRILVTERHGVAAGSERACSCQTAQAATHHDHSIFFTRRIHRDSLAV